MNRKEIVKRHNPVNTKIDPYTPLTVGNGEFAYTADITGMQTFSEEYKECFPLCTQSQWGWHTKPSEDRGISYSLDDIAYKEFDVNGKSVKYPTLPSQKEKAAYDWLRVNPHRLHLGQIGFEILTGAGKKAKACDIKDAKQELDLYSGILTSEFYIDGETVKTTTLCHPDEDVVSFRVKSELFSKNRLTICLNFPYGSEEKHASDWDRKDFHTTQIIEINNLGFSLKRTLDDDIYYVQAAFDSTARAVVTDRHKIEIGSKKDEVLLSVRFSKKSTSTGIPSFSEAFKACENGWENYWQQGGMIDFGKCTDERADELERRVILSQYLMKVQCSGIYPPQETGLSFNSWYGKFHLEMHWWHGVHFALWNRAELFEKSLWWYSSILDNAKNTAKSQGYEGARWPKMTDPSGNESPSFIGPYLIWQQPHPIYYAELLYSLSEDKNILEKYRDIVFETAKFMASYAFYDEKEKRYILGPALIPAQENHNPAVTINPTFELEYWHFGLSVANKWRERLGMDKNKLWSEIADKLSDLPQKDGVYLAHENCPDTYTRFNTDHPSMVGAMGILKGEKADVDIMRNTLKKVFDEWNIDSGWGWDFPMMAMTAARLDMPEEAVDILLRDAPKNTYLLNGHNMQGDKYDLPIYLPGNGGLLSAVAMMAAGWQGCEKKNPGFPKNGMWEVEWEDLNKML